jgi:hypothetical protein
MEDMAMADATAIVTIFTVQLRCSGKMDVLRARLVTQTRGTLKASPHHKIRLFVHAHVMDVRAQKENYWQSTTRRALLDEMIGFTLQRHSRTTGLPCDGRVRRSHPGRLRIQLNDRVDQST